MSMTQLPAGIPVPAAPRRRPGSADDAGGRAGRVRVGRHGLLVGAVALAVAGPLFVLYPAVRPFSDEKSLQAAQAWASAGWTLAHTLAMLGFIGVCLGLLGLHLSLAGTRARRLSLRALVVSWIGAGLTLPYYGAETYALRAIGRQALADHNAGLLTLADQVRGGPGEVIFGIGLGLLAVGGVTAAVAAWRSAVLQKWGAALLGAGLVLFIPQFWGSQPLRITHGVVMAAGCQLLAAGLWRRGTAGPGAGFRSRNTVACGP